MGRDSQARERILIVEDEPSVLDLIVQVMEMEGYEVVSARNGHDALALIRETAFDFIICDVKMPDLSGEAFYEEVERGYPRLRRRIAFVTGDTFSSESIEFLDRTGAPYLLKPFNLTDLKKMVAESLERIRRQGEENDALREEEEC